MGWNTNDAVDSIVTRIGSARCNTPGIVWVDSDDVTAALAVASEVTGERYPDPEVFTHGDRFPNAADRVALDFG